MVASPGKYPSEIDRYYTKFYEKREEKLGEDVCVLAHSNKVCIITITPDHKSLQGGPIKSFEYIVETGGKKVGDIHGKRKLEAIKVKTGTPLCKITSADGTEYVVNSPVRGKLCELNDNLTKDLTLLTRMPETNGYLAIVLHHTCHDDEFCDYLLTQEEYARGLSLPKKKGANDDEHPAVINIDVDVDEKVEIEEKDDTAKRKLELENMEVSPKRPRT